MLKQKELITENWSDYELIDSGDGAKLERFGNIILDRPETQALWKPITDSWKEATARYTHTDGKGLWHMIKSAPNEWTIQWDTMSMELSKTNFKHVGMFPEQAANWEWIKERVQGLKSPKVLNLFGYTGAASIVAALAGAHVTHVDASKQSLDWAHKNADLSKVPNDGIRYIPDDAMKFVARDVRRNAKYEGIILDPPAFGRGLKGEVWKIEEDLIKLIQTTKELLSDTPGSFFLLNGYAAGYSATAFKQLVESVFGDVNGEYGELHIAESSGGRTLPTGIYVRFVR
jgi:23S rRNA (cytosine1962-C5)-methyltransferase